MARPRAETAALLAVAAAVVVLALPILSQPWTIDEPVFVAVARHILGDPFHPYSFDFNWYGRAASMGGIDGNPPLFPYLLAVCWKVGGGREWAVRLMLLPLTLLAAFGVYGLASRFVRRPLWPTLAVIASPAWAINMPHAMSESLFAAVAFPALYGAVRGVDEADGRFFWGSAVLFAAALMTKYAAAFLLAPAVFYMLARGTPRREACAYALIALLPLAAYLIHARALAALGHVLSTSTRESYAAPLARARALLAFAGGLGFCAAIWALASGCPRPRMIAWTALAAILFATAPAEWPARAQGFIFGCAALCALDAVWTDGDLLLGAWTASGLALVACYWSVTARTTLFLLPPLMIAAARRLEGRWERARSGPICAVSTAALAALTLALASVDVRYARAQRGVAEATAREYAGRALWCGSHWGLQHYMAERGARELDWTRGGWDEAKTGDVVVLSRVNSNVLWPERKVMAEMRTIGATSSIPLRLMSGWGGQAGFYSNKSGFLPFALSREPLDEFLVAEIASPEKVLHGVHGARNGPGL